MKPSRRLKNRIISRLKSGISPQKIAEYIEKNNPDYTTEDAVRTVERTAASRADRLVIATTIYMQIVLGFAVYVLIQWSNSVSITVIYFLFAALFVGVLITSCLRLAHRLKHLQLHHTYSRSFTVVTATWVVVFVLAVISAYVAPEIVDTSGHYLAGFAVSVFGFVSTLVIGPLLVSVVLNAAWKSVHKDYAFFANERRTAIRVKKQSQIEQTRPHTYAMRALVISQLGLGLIIITALREYYLITNPAPIILLLLTPFLLSWLYLSGKLAHYQSITSPRLSAFRVLSRAWLVTGVFLGSQIYLSQSLAYSDLLSSVSNSTNLEWIVSQVLLGAAVLVPLLLHRNLLKEDIDRYIK